MAYQATDSKIGYGASLTATDSPQKYPAGTVVVGYDDAFGYGEFVYLKGVASTAVGSVVRYDEAGVTTLTVAGSRGNCAVALSANTSTSAWGWYQVRGLAVVKAGTVVADKPAYATASGGVIDDAVVAGDMITGITTMTADGAGATTVGGVPINGTSPSFTVAAGTALCTVLYPHMAALG